MLYYPPLIQALKDQTAVNTEHRTEASRVLHTQGLPVKMWENRSDRSHRLYVH